MHEGEWMPHRCYPKEPWVYLDPSKSRVKMTSSATVEMGGGGRSGYEMTTGCARFLWQL